MTPAASAAATTATRRAQLAEVGRLSSASRPGRQRHSSLDPGGIAVGAGSPGIAPDQELEVGSARETGVFVDWHA